MRSTRNRLKGHTFLLQQSSGSTIMICHPINNPIDHWMESPSSHGIVLAVNDISHSINQLINQLKRKLNNNYQPNQLLMVGMLTPSTSIIAISIIGDLQVPRQTDSTLKTEGLCVSDRSEMVRTENLFHLPPALPPAQHKREINKQNRRKKREQTSEANAANDFSISLFGSAQIAHNTQHTECEASNHVGILSVDTIPLNPS